MTGFYAPFVYAGGGSWFKHHVVRLDPDGGLVSIHPFDGETERTIACQGLLLPAFFPTENATPEAALEWLNACLANEKDTTLHAVLERALPHVVLMPGMPVRLWNLENVDPVSLRPGADAVLRQVYP